MLARQRGALPFWMGRTLGLVLLLLSLSGAQALNENPVLSKYFFIPKNQAALEEVGDRFEIGHKHGAGFEVYVPVPEKNSFLAIAPEARLLEADTSAKWQNLSREERAAYHTFDSVQSDLKKFAEQYPKLATTLEYGKSKEGRPLVGLRLLSPIPLRKTRPQIVITSATHGDELITVEVVFGILESLLKGYGTDERLTRIVDETEIYFLPVINPDGYTRQQRYANGIDPNRDYPWPEQPNRNPNPCIKSVMDFFASKKIVASIDYHSSGAMIMYPWAYTSSPVSSEHKAIFHDLTGKMAKSNNYVYGSIATTIYVAKGSSADYYYWKHGTWSLGIEISTDGPSSQIPKLVKENLESTYVFLEKFISPS